MKILGTTKIVGVIGYPIKHTYSPIMMNAAFEHLGLDYVYLPFQVKPEKLKEAIFGLVALGIKGVNVTIPHKETVIPFLDTISDEAKLIGAVNTIKVEEDGSLSGYNTDGIGFIEALEQELSYSICGTEIFVLGAGGASRAVSVMLALKGAKKVYISDIIPEKAIKLVEDINTKIKPVAEFIQADFSLTSKMSETIKKVDLLVNATPIGMNPEDPCLFSEEVFHPRLKIFDLVYNPAETKLIKVAKEKGCSATNGIGMLIKQGIHSFKIWTGVQAPEDVMRAALKRLISF